MTPVLLLGQAIAATTWKHSQDGQTHLMHDNRDNDSTCSHAVPSTPCSHMQLATSPLLVRRIVEVLYQQPNRMLKPPPYSMSDMHTAKDSQSKVYSAGCRQTDNVHKYKAMHNCDKHSHKREQLFACIQMVSRCSQVA